MGGRARGYDGGKKVQGRKRHVLIDTKGFLLEVKDHGADIMDRDGIKVLLEGVRQKFPRLSHLWLDAGYNGKGKGKDWVEKTLGLAAEIVRHPPKPHYVWAPEGEKPDWDDLRARKLLAEPGFKVLPRRWGGGTLSRLDGPESQDEQGLRASTREWRSVHVLGYESLDGEVAGPQMRLFGRFLKARSTSIPTLPA